MKSIPLYRFYRHKYGSELLFDVLSLDYIMAGIRRHPVHRESFYQIILFTQGSDEVTVDGCARRTGAGEVACSRPGDLWQWNVPTPLEGYAIVFEGDFLLSFFNDPHFLDSLTFLRRDRPSPFLVPDGKLWQRLVQLCWQMEEEIGRAEKDQHMLRALLYAFLMLLDRADCAEGGTVSTQEIHTGRYLDRFLELADEEYREHHDVEYYADRLCITPNYLNRIVSASLGMTTKQYINTRLLNEARRLLSYTTSSVSEISETLCFDSPSYFVRFFRKSTGMTPARFRNGGTAGGADRK